MWMDACTQASALLPTPRNPVVLTLAVARRSLLTSSSAPARNPRTPRAPLRRACLLR